MAQHHSRRSQIDATELYVSRAAYKLDSVADILNLDFNTKVVLDVGSSTGGFSDYALKHGAQKVIAVEKGTNQMDQTLKLNSRLELHEKTDIRSFIYDQPIDLVLIDVSFISLREILPSIRKFTIKGTRIIAMVKPQFEANNDKLLNHGVIKNETIRRQVLLSLESWLKDQFVIEGKADSKVTGTKGNKERFYKLYCSK